MGAKIVQSVSPYSWSGKRENNWIDFEVAYEDGDQIVVFLWLDNNNPQRTVNIDGFLKYQLNINIDLYLKKMQGSGILRFRGLGRGDVPYLNGTAHVIRGAKPIILSSARQGLNNYFTFESKQSNVVLSFAGSLDSYRVDNVGINSPYKRESGNIIISPYWTSVISYSQSAGISIRTAPAAGFNLWKANAIGQLPIESEDNPNLFLVQDGDIIKTYQNGNWQTI
ncbi:hypothetical protein NST86_33975 [Bacillus sp. FSL L8-0199]|uniref:hypothetical protein n=1 Tax=Bacillus sp. FSL L8-0199 TaxID=2954616 RepID=UPI0030FBEEC8